MALIGRPNSLPIVRAAPPGLYLDGGTHGEILLPGRYIPPGALPGCLLDVFVYRDSEDRLVATTESPYAVVGEFAFLRVVSVNPRVGVFLDWGLEKDLLLPMREQAGPVKHGDWLVVRVALDGRTDRIIASARLNRWLNLTAPAYAEGQRVKILISGETPLGYNAIVEHAHRGLIYRADLASPLAVGQPLEGYVRALRPDGKIDLALDRAGYRRIAPLTEQILAALESNGGRMPYHDNSAPEEIRAVFGVSKKAFKQAIGALYRARRIRIDAHGIRIATADAGAFFSRGAPTVVYNAVALRDDEKRLRGNQHPAGETTLIERKTTMGDRSPKSVQKQASQKQSKSNDANSKKQQLINAQQAAKARLAANMKK